MLYISTNRSLSGRGTNLTESTPDRLMQRAVSPATISDVTMNRESKITKMTHIVSTVQQEGTAQYEHSGRPPAGPAAAEVTATLCGSSTAGRPPAIHVVHNYTYWCIGSCGALPAAMPPYGNPIDETLHERVYAFPQLDFTPPKTSLNNGRFPGSRTQHALATSAMSVGASSGMSGRKSFSTTRMSISLGRVTFAHGPSRESTSQTTIPKL